VVGVSNIMLISVQERTREIGIRKAVGARPSAIVGMILQEALVITLVSGYLGLVAAVGLVTAVKQVLPPTPYFRQPDVDLAVGLAATVVLAAAGALAGLFPALRAARINPIQALRVE
jgi:putative ABC transport system permease protein